MTIEEMVKLAARHRNCYAAEHENYKYFNSIIAALRRLEVIKRAGQAMRDADTNDEWHEARQAWDKALGDGE